ncbi:unnamed protein product [Diplocarpon coronariae]
MKSKPANFSLLSATNWRPDLPVAPGWLGTAAGAGSTVLQRCSSAERPMQTEYPEPFPEVCSARLSR